MLAKILDILVPFGPFLRETEGKKFLSNWQQLVLQVIPLTFFISWICSFIPFGGLLYFFIGIPLAARLHPKTATFKSHDILLWYFVVIATGVGSLRGFIGHFFLSDFVAEQIGWQTGSPFQIELAFMQLGVALASFGAIWKRQNLTEGVAVLMSVFLLGAAFVHLNDVFVNHNFSPFNVGSVLAGDLIMPIIFFYLLYQKAVK
ncbi:MAG: hypothetical protein M3Q81_00350 [bacterium]|nr:hypothetical protein [bacterium]